MLEGSEQRKRKYHNSPAPWGDDPLSYYRKYYEGVTVGKLEDINYRLYIALRSKKLLDSLPKKTDLPERLKEVDLIEYYKENYPNISRTRLWKVDRELKNALNRAKLLDEIPRKTLPEWGDDPLGFYNAHFKGKTQRDLVLFNWDLYRELKKHDLLKYVPTSRPSS